MRACFLFALAVVAGGCTRAHAAADGTGEATPDVPLAVARVGDFVERVEIAGRVGPPAGSGAKLSFAGSGIVSKIDVRVGDSVRAGQPLAELDRSALRAALDQAEGDARAAVAGYGSGAVGSAALQGAEARLALATTRLAALQRGGPAAGEARIAAESAARQAAIKVELSRAALTRATTLQQAGVVAAKDVDAARAQLASDLADERSADARLRASSADADAALRSAQAEVASARSDVEAARAQQGVLGGQAASAQGRLDAARVAYSNGVLDAPQDGVVLAILKRPGEAADPTTPVVELGPALGHSVSASVPGDVARRIAPGDVANLALPRAGSAGARGIVDAVVPAVDPATQLATVVIRGVPPDAVPGDAVRATIVVGRARGILVPSTAVVQDPQTGDTVVFVRTQHPNPGDAAFALRRVAIGASDSRTAEIASGLRAGESVAARGGYTLLAPVGG